ncbi:MAG: T9SS type A sorting domain-containing protein [Bacteroidetes bacterium]|nr:T9SS type A sorting domain-containing protein [Bacteroidota bacterium]
MQSKTKSPLLTSPVRGGIIFLIMFFLYSLPNGEGWGGASFCSAQISGGGLHSLSICNDSTVRSWGYNNDGQLGIGDTIDKSTAQQVHGVGNVGFLTGITALATGGNPLEGISHSLALKYNGTVWAWGRNNHGQLGDGDTIRSWTPLQVHGFGNVGFLTGITTIAGGGYHTLAIKNDSTVWAWGRNNHGQLGVGDTNTSFTPVQVNLLTGITAIAGGWGNSLALKNDSTVWAWGQNYLGQLGLGDTTDRHTPVQISSLTGITAISAGGGHCLAIKNDSTAWAWGYNSFGQLGDSTNTDRHTPVQVLGLTSVIAVSVGAGHSLALKNDGTVWAWGFNQLGQLGDSTTTLNKNYPQQVNILTGISVISAGGGHSVALKNDSTVWAWGYNAQGQLGDGTTIQSAAPVQVIGLCPVSNAVNEIAEPISVSVFPNPSSGVFTVSGLQSAVYGLEIYNVFGELVFQTTVNPVGNNSNGVNRKQETVNLSSQPNGIYFLHIKTEQGSAVKKIIISH